MWFLNRMFVRYTTLFNIFEKNVTFFVEREPCNAVKNFDSELFFQLVFYSRDNYNQRIISLVSLSTFFTRQDKRGVVEFEIFRVYKLLYWTICTASKAGGSVLPF